MTLPKRLSAIGSGPSQLQKDDLQMQLPICPICPVLSRLNIFKLLPDLPSGLQPIVFSCLQLKLLALFIIKSTIIRGRGRRREWQKENLYHLYYINYLLFWNKKLVQFQKLKNRRQTDFERRDRKKHLLSGGQENVLQKDSRYCHRWRLHRGRAEGVMGNVAHLHDVP